MTTTENESQGNWIECSKELPEKDGSYEICNHPELENDNLKRECTTTAYYDGYGFQWLGIYRMPKYWRKYNMAERKYGKQI